MEFGERVFKDLPKKQADHVYIKDIQPGKLIDGIYMVTQPVLRNTTRGDLYIAMFLSDKTGKCNCRMWQATEQIYDSIPKEGFLKIQGKSELYQGSLQLVVNKVQPVSSEQVKLTDYMPRTDKNVNELFSEIKDILSAIKNTDIKKLVDAFLADEELMKQFRTAPAAVQMHHNYLGGLIEHTHNMLKVAQKVLPLYPKVQADIVLAAIFLHDMAKTRELSFEMGFSYTDSGQLVGHIVMGAVMIEEKASSISPAVDRSVIDSLVHIIVSHHGKYEFGSPKLPATAEALMVNYIDDLDAKMNYVFDLVENDPSDTDWTSWKRSDVTVGTKYYRKKIDENDGNA